MTQQNWANLAQAIENRESLDECIALINACTDLEVRDNNTGFTPLLYAINFYDWEIATALLDKGADANAKTRGGMPALVLACEKSVTGIITPLLEKGAQINACGSNGNTALHYTAHNGDLRSTKLLLEHGADMEMNHGQVTTALVCATLAGKAHIVEHLLKSGADPNTTLKNEGSPPLIIAVDHGYTDIVRLLLAHNADIDATRSNGMTAKDYAQKNGADDIMTLLQTEEKRRITESFQKASDKGTSQPRKVIRPKPAGGTA
ncbi:MAG: ankyrin repeat domain-containing protein [Alphaproteobacteria bacterium]|nr:ankyrin repeat domain-containing protein [Alphaproteobacteria bacterium]